MRINRIVVGPHQGKLQIVTVGRLQEPFLQAAFTICAVGKVIIVKNKRINPMIRRRFDFAAHVCRIGFVLISPQGNFGLFVSRKAGSRILHDTPLCPIFTMEPLIARIDVPIGKIVGTDERPLIHENRLLADCVTNYYSTKKTSLLLIRLQGRET
ncbi:hypothetical protein SDC9_169119 [bioreactor metagenome]|uniref:Uncharacterized protein n=1 Tax=bioreactor metagenome TaxID=1076179 RepID=A0A645G7H8_9ZZZZ